MRLVSRVFFANAAIIVVAALVLALSPATISFPIGDTQAVVLAVGTGLLLLINLWLLRRAFRPFDELVAFMGRVDPLRPGERPRLTTADPDVLAVAAGMEEMLDRLEAERRESGRRQLLAQESERRRVARELHDEVGQLLTAALLQLDQAELGEARTATEAALEEVRAISRRLRPLVLDDLGLEDALTALCATVAKRSGLEVRRDFQPDALIGLTTEQELVLYRVAQESLTNVVRHAGATAATVSVRRDDDHVELRIDDNGRGLAARPEGTGILGMRERALLVAGLLGVSDGPHGGASVVLAMPVGQ